MRVPFTNIKIKFHQSVNFDFHNPRRPIFNPIVLPMNGLQAVIEFKTISKTESIVTNQNRQKFTQSNEIHICQLLLLFFCSSNIAQVCQGSTCVLIKMPIACLLYFKKEIDAAKKQQQQNIQQLQQINFNYCLNVFALLLLSLLFFVCVRNLIWNFVFFFGFEQPL